MKYNVQNKLYLDNQTQNKHTNDRFVQNLQKQGFPVDFPVIS